MLLKEDDWSLKKLRNAGIKPNRKEKGRKRSFQSQPNLLLSLLRPVLFGAQVLFAILGGPAYTALQSPLGALLRQPTSRPLIYLVTPEPEFINFDPIYIKGNKGTTGVQGPQGPPGLAGRDGTPGSPGPLGKQGDRGVEGSDGRVGVKGENGIPGAQGSYGIPGTNGVHGTPGDHGVRGIEGPEGEKGDPGDKGDKGVKGKGKFA